MRPSIYLFAMLATTTIFAADLPIKQVVLYKHGVGYFERSGQLGPKESARLDFKASEMNDVLKSLTIVEKGGGKVSGLRYDSSEPLEHKLAEFPFRIGDKQPLSAMLDQLKGAQLEIKFGTEPVVGSIVSARVVRGDEKQPEREQVTLLMDSGEFRSFDLAAAASIKFVDPSLQQLFKSYLTTLVQARSKEKRSVYIDSNELKSRLIFASYMVPMPVWKSSYRLIFDHTAQPTFEGWAVVDNTTGEDWTNVRLSLVSGRPISFVSRLYEPRHINRPMAELPEEQARAPILHEGAVEERKDEKGQKETEKSQLMRSYADAAGLMKMAPGAVPGGMGGGGGAGVGPGTGPSIRTGSEVRTEVASSIAAAAPARELGELFEYRMAAPVTVRRNESAMLPFLQQKISGRKLLIYADQSSAHPMNAVEITNDTGKTLDGGPLTIFDGGAYAGEALMETLKNGDKRLISYALDLGTRLTTKLDSETTPVREITLRQGLLTTRSSIVETKTYTVRNVDNKAKTLILEHPIRPQYKLVNRKPSGTTPTAYRFEVKLAAGATEKFPVTEERIYESSSVILSMTPDVLVTYIQNKTLSESGRKQLQQILDQKRKIVNASEEVLRTEAEINNLVQDQDRIRKNISSLNSVNGQQQQVQDYARQLASEDNHLAALRDRMSKLQRNREALESELNALIEKMEF